MSESGDEVDEMGEQEDDDDDHGEEEEGEEEEADETEDNDEDDGDHETEEETDAGSGEADEGEDEERGEGADEAEDGMQRPQRADSSRKLRVARRSGGKVGRGGRPPFGRTVTISTLDCKYEVVKKAAKARGFCLVASGDDRCNIFWIDVSTIHERFAKIEPWQRINHFPGMSNISRKNRLAQNLGKMRRKFPKDYSFFPRTWVLPHDANDFRAQFDQDGHSKQVFIIKPDNSSKGRGIFLVNNVEKVNLTEPLVAQMYISRPLLLDGYKFDIRLYALVTSCSPLRMYKFKDGLVRLCTEEYVRPCSSNLDERCMHLTNYAINRFSENYEAAADAEQTDKGSKRSLKWLMRWLGGQYGEARAQRCWERMGSLCVKTVVSILPTLMREYRTMFGGTTDHHDSGGAGSKGPGVTVKTEGGVQVRVDPVRGSRSFEILGFDVMLDNNLKPWLIEVNTLPSFATDSKVDELVKRPLVEQTLSILKARPSDHRNHTLMRKYESEQRTLKKNAARAEASGRNQMKDEANVVVRCRRKIEEMFRRFAPDRLEMLDHLMRKYKGREASLLSSVLRRYNNATREGDGDEGEADEEEEEFEGGGGGRGTRRRAFSTHKQQQRKESLEDDMAFCRSRGSSSSSSTSQGSRISGDVDNRTRKASSPPLEGQGEGRKESTAGGGGGGGAAGVQRWDGSEGETRHRSHSVESRAEGAECLRSARRVDDSSSIGQEAGKQGRGHASGKCDKAGAEKGEGPSLPSIAGAIAGAASGSRGRTSSKSNTKAAGEDDTPPTFDMLRSFQRPSSEQQHQHQKARSPGLDRDVLTSAGRASTGLGMRRQRTPASVGKPGLAASATAGPQAAPQQPEDEDEREEAAILAEETAKLRDFERLYPPLPQEAGQEQRIDELEERYTDFILYACEQEHKLLQCGGPQPGQVARRRREASASQPPPQQSEGGVEADPQGLPPLSARRSDDSRKGLASSQERRPRRKTMPNSEERRAVAMQLKLQLRAAERLSRGYSTMSRSTVKPQPEEGADMLAGKLRLKQMRAQERRQRLVFQFARPGFTALKAQTLEFPLVMTAQHHQQQQLQHHQQHLAQLHTNGFLQLPTATLTASSSTRNLVDLLG